MSTQQTVSDALSKWWSRRRGGGAGGAVERETRYDAKPMISPAQIKFYHYLQDAFPARAVLPAQPLSRLVSVRYARNRERAARRLEELEVDFVVCDPNGKPLIAFQIDAFRPDESDEKQRRQAAAKNHVLDTAGIRLLRLKTTTRNLPTPDEFRQRVDALLDGAPARAAASRATPPNRMTMTDLMGLPDAPPPERE
jgi:hypothetical protein